MRLCCQVAPAICPTNYHRFPFPQSRIAWFFFLAQVNGERTMLSYMLPTEDKPPPGDSNQANYRASKLQKSLRERPPIASKPAGKVITVSPKKYVDTGKTMIVSTKIEEHAGDQQQHHRQDEQQQHGVSAESPKHNGTVVKKSTLHTSKVTKDDSLYSINSEASTVGSDRKNKIFNGAKHTSLKR